MKDTSISNHFYHDSRNVLFPAHIIIGGCIYTCGRFGGLDIETVLCQNKIFSYSEQGINVFAGKISKEDASRLLACASVSMWQETVYQIAGASVMTNIPKSSLSRACRETPKIVQYEKVKKSPCRIVQIESEIQVCGM